MTVVPLQNNVRQVVPLQKQEPAEPVKPMFTPEEAKALSAAAQAKLNNADWMAKYREMSKNTTPRVDSISMQNQMAAALRDPVYGQATATGLAAGEGMLNSWIAGINSRARRDENNLANERWIKAMDDLAEERKLRRDELAESKKVYVPGETLPDPLMFADEATRKADLEARAKVPTQGRIARNQIEAAKMAEESNRALVEYLKNREKAPKTVSVKPRTEEEVMNEALETARDRGDLFSGFKILDEAGKASKGDFSSRSFNDSPLQIKISKFLEDELGPGTIRYPGLSGYAKDLKASGMDDAARQVLNLIPKLAREGHKTLELVVGDNPRAPAYLRTSQGLFMLTPDEAEPLKGVILE